MRRRCSSIWPALLFAARFVAAAAAAAAITAVGVGVDVDDGAVIVIQQTDDLRRAAVGGAEAAVSQLTRHAHVARGNERCSCWSRYPWRRHGCENERGRRVWTSGGLVDSWANGDRSNERGQWASAAAVSATSCKSGSGAGISGSTASNRAIAANARPTRSFES